MAADSGALAGANVVSSYHTAATVVDASILSLGLAGFATIGTRAWSPCSFRAPRLSADIIDTGTQIIKTRNKFAKSASERACRNSRRLCRIWSPHVPCRQYRRRIPMV